MGMAMLEFWNFFQTSDLIGQAFPSSTTANQRVPFIFAPEQPAYFGYMQINFPWQVDYMVISWIFYIFYKIQNLFTTRRGKSHFFSEFLVL